MKRDVEQRSEESAVRVPAGGDGQQPRVRPSANAPTDRGFLRYRRPTALARLILTAGVKGEQEHLPGAGYCALHGLGRKPVQNLR